ncbi:Type I phosphodiesterase/nucleotide pyrophosphatase [Balamuthia mandrillaris]
MTRNCGGGGRRRDLGLGLGLALFMTTLACVVAAVVADGAVHPVFLFSIDGMRTDYVQKAKELKLTTLTRLIEEGVLAKGAYSVYPAVTFPSHTSMITGVYPAKHGIWNNNMFGPLDNNSNNHYFYNNIKVKTLFDAVVEQGWGGIGVDWPVSVGAPLDLLFPGNDPNPPSLAEANWLYNSIKGLPYIRDIIPDASALFLDLLDDKRLAMGLRFLKHSVSAKRPPALIAFHFNDLDHYEHLHGYMSPRAVGMLQTIDAYLGKFLAYADSLGLLSNATVIVTSDHGFVNTTRQEISPGNLLYSLGAIGPSSSSPWQAWTDCSTGVCPIYIHPDAPAQVKHLVDQAVAILKSDPAYAIERVYTSQEMEELGCWPGAYLMLSLKTGYVFQNYDPAYPDVRHCCNPNIGQHGYAADLPEMFASFIIRGPTIKKGAKIGMVRLIDIAPTVAHIMGLSLPDVQGRIISEAFEASP